jgi:hypothetical protein
MAKPRGINTAAKARISAALTSAIKGSEESFAKSSQQTKNVVFGEKERFDPWEAATPGHNNATPGMLGENTGGQDSTRVTHCQYFFNKDTSVGNMYVKFRRAGSQYVYMNVPVYAAKSFYNALSKGKTINNGLERYMYSKSTDGDKFGLPDGTEYGRKVQNGNVTPREEDQTQLSLF